MKPVLLYFPGAGPTGHVAESMGRLFTEVKVVGLTYPGWRELTDPEGAMDGVLGSVERQVAARTDGRPVLIVGYSLGAQIGWAFANRLLSRGGSVAFFGAINGRVVAADRPQGRWLRRAIQDFAIDFRRGGIGAAGAFMRSRISRLVQRAAGDDLPRMAAGWAGRGRLPWYMARNPAFETELSMRLLIRAAVPWTRRIESELPPLDCPAMLVRGREDEAYDDRWRALCPRLVIEAVDGDHVAILQPPRFESVVSLIRDAARERGALRMTPADAVNDSARSGLA